MYSRFLAEMFPSEDIRPLWSCSNTACFYVDVLFNPSELEWGERWCHTERNLVPVPRCPSCRTWMEVYVDAEKA